MQFVLFLFTERGMSGQPEVRSFLETVGLLDIRHKIAKKKLNKMAQTMEIRKMAPTALIVKGQAI